MIKTKLAELFMWLCVYFSPTFPLILSIGFFVAADFTTGIIAAIKQKDPITSFKMRMTVLKFMAYGLCILVAHIMEAQFIPDFPALKIIAGFIAYVEIKSMNENIEKITGMNIFKSILEKINIKNG